MSVTSSGEENENERIVEAMDMHPSIRRPAAAAAGPQPSQGLRTNGVAWSGAGTITGSFRARNFSPQAMVWQQQQAAVDRHLAGQDHREQAFRAFLVRGPARTDESRWIGHPALRSLAPPLARLYPSPEAMLHDGFDVIENRLLEVGVSLPGGVSVLLESLVRDA